MAVVKFFVLVVLPILVAVYVFGFFGSNTEPAPTMKDGWWGRDPIPSTPPSKDDQPVPFSIKTSNATLADLRFRLKNTRFPESIEGTAFEYGFHSNYLHKVVAYWKDEFNWEKQQAKLNSFPQFRVKIEGIDIHYVRIEPKKTGTEEKKKKKRRTLLLLHGWPENFWEFYKVFPLLTQPKSAAKEDEEVFEVICPSIPGFGFSEAPHKPGFDVSDAARVFFKLMRKLGHEKFFVHGGDWGGYIGAIMAQAYPSNVIGVHVNFAPPSVLTKSDGLSGIVRQLVGDFLPSIIYSPAEMQLRKTAKQKILDTLSITGYMHIQATSPDTVAAGLTDSPAGLAAYILEIYSTFSDYANRRCSEGCITDYFTLDELLTNVMIYWISGSIGSSVRFYKEYFISNEAQQWDGLPVLIPSGIASFPNEAWRHIRSIVETKFHNIVHYTDMPKGGHFAALEVPELLAEDIKAFVRAVERL